MRLSAMIYAFFCASVRWSLKDAWNLRDAFLLRRKNTTVAGDYAKVTVDDRIDESELRSEERGLFICSGEWVRALLTYGTSFVIRNEFAFQSLSSYRFTASLNSLYLSVCSQVG